MKAGYNKEEGSIVAPARLSIVDKFLLKLFPTTKAITIADLGGTTQTYRHFQKLFPNSPIYNINLVKEQIKGVPNPLVEDMLNTFLKSNSVDVAFASGIDEFIIEVRRILKKKGFFILTTPNLCDWLNRIFILFGFSPSNYNSSKYWFGNPLMSGKGDGHKCVFAYRGIKEFLEYYGFKILKNGGLSFFW